MVSRFTHVQRSSPTPGATLRRRLRRPSRVTAGTRCYAPGAMFLLLLLGKDLGVALAVRIEARLVALLPGSLQLRLTGVPVGPAALQDGAQVVAQLFDGGPAEEPVAHVDLVDAQARLEHERVRDHRVVVRVGVLGDVEVLLHLATWIGEEGPARADAGAELVRLGQAVSADGHQPAIPDLHLAMKLQEP